MLLGLDWDSRATIVFKGLDWDSRATIVFKGLDWNSRATIAAERTPLERILADGRTWEKLEPVSVLAMVRWGTVVADVGLFGTISRGRKAPRTTS